MQIDFHHSVTYSLSRLAGFTPEQASIIGYSAQYVDDAVNSGVVKFTNGAMYSRISSAHKMLDYRNFKELANHHVWIPFHFLPGNGGLPAGENPEGTFIQKLICRPNSFVARDMLRASIEERNQPYALHRLGITMHVYADTWAHQNFAGVNHEANEVIGLNDVDEPGDKLISHVANYFGDLWDKVKSKVTGATLPLGHGAALSCPDKPWLKWNYTSGLGEKIERNNTELFLDAASHMYRALVAFQNGDAEVKNSDFIPEKDFQRIRDNFLGFVDNDGNARHANWLKSIAEGQFSFGAETVDYIPKGEGSWKHAALGTTREKDLESDEFPYDASFLKSDWKLFHDALQIHRLDIMKKILPRYGICAA